ncbi:hypothetical protein [Floccifex sp.]|uniref:hypothetical protein n=1 Tax=Floccifex sp. TaxID=2815810 RepID=UPI003F079059
METMTELERKQLKKLQAKAKRVSRQQKEFLEYADEHKDELLKRWNLSIKKEISLSESLSNELSNKLNTIADIYGTNVNSLLDYISTDKQVNYFKRYGPKEEFKNEQSE